MRKPDFTNLLQVLAGEKPSRPTLFEFAVSERIFQRVCPGCDRSPEARAQAWAELGYDYAFLHAGLQFTYGPETRAASISLNESPLINSWEDFEKYPWPNVDDFDYSLYATVKLPPGMKLIAWGPNGILENLIRLVGFDQLCFLCFDQPDLVQAITDRIADLEYAHYERALQFPAIGACFVNDDWGFAQGPMLRPEDMRRYIVPQTARLVRLIHDAGRPALQHSCGNVFDCGLIEDVIDVCRFDGRHSYEDKILPVETAYDRYHHRLAILGGLDVDFLCRSTPEQVAQRARAMLERSEADGAYALGSGNSIPDYVPMENYFAMIATIHS